MRRRLFALIRAGTALVLIVAVALVSALRSAQAHLGEGLLGFGGELAGLVDARLHSKPRQLTVNGLELRLVTASTPLSVHDALERFAGVCRSRGGLSGPSRALHALGVSALEGMLRQESEREGVIACLDTGHPLDLAELSARLLRLRDTGDLGELGALRYALARRDGNKTTLLSFWTEGQANLLKMFPKSGDAPGRDPEGIPRPAGSRRLLFAAEHGMPYAITAYAVQGQSVQGLAEWYRRTLVDGGWTVQDGGRARVFVGRRGERTIMIRVGQTDSGRLFTTVAELS